MDLDLLTMLGICERGHRPAAVNQAELYCYDSNPKSRMHPNRPAIGMFANLVEHLWVACDTNKGKIQKAFKMKGQV